MVIFSFLPKNCENLILDFASIDWKKRFTLNVIPFLNSTHTVGINDDGEPCVSCYLKAMQQKKKPCGYCKWTNAIMSDECDFKLFMYCYNPIVSHANRVNIDTYEKFQLWFQIWINHISLKSQLLEAIGK